MGRSGSWGGFSLLFLILLVGCKSRPLFASAQQNHPDDHAPVDLGSDDGTNADAAVDAHSVGDGDVHGDGSLGLDAAPRDLAHPADGDHAPPHVDPLLCGNGMLDYGEECDIGVFNGVLQITLSQVGRPVLTVGPIIHQGDVLSYYAYANGSSHIGNERVGEGRLFLYYDPKTHIGSFVISNGADDPAQPMAHMKLKLDVSFPVTIPLCDDATDKCVASNAEFGLMSGDWHFGGETAGAILTGVPLTSAMTILVAPSFDQGIDTWSYIDGTGQRIDLDMDELTYVRAEPDTEMCKLDCTNP